MANYELCPNCARKTFNLDSGKCDYCSIKNRNKGDIKPIETKPETLKKKIQITTAPGIEGYKIIDTLDVITAECVFGMNVFRDFFASVSDFWGGRSNATQKVLRDARNKCLYELRREAAFMGANAIIGVALDYSQFTGKGKSMLFLVASGTAVKAAKIKKAQSLPKQMKAIH